MGLPGLSVRNPAVPDTHHTPDYGCRAVPMALRPNIRLLRGGVRVHAPVHQRGYDHRPDACDRHSPAAAFIRRLLALGLHYFDIYFPGAVPEREEVFLIPRIILTFALLHILPWWWNGRHEGLRHN